MTNRRLDAGISGVTTLLLACVACTSLQDLSSYSAGSSDAAPPESRPSGAADSDQPITPAPTPTTTPDAGPVESPSVEAQNPADVPLIPPLAMDAGADCTGPGEFTEPPSTSCYRLAGTTSSWGEARDLCEAWGGDLAKVESVEENTLLAERSDRDVWLGASDLEDEGDFRWFDGDDAEGPWATAQPDNYQGQEDCLELREQDGRWNDVPCMSEKGALCERALAGQEAP